MVGSVQNGFTLKGRLKFLINVEWYCRRADKGIERGMNWIVFFFPSEYEGENIVDLVSWNLQRVCKEILYIYI